MGKTFKHVIKVCNDFDVALQHREDLTDQEKDSLCSINLDLAKAVVLDIDKNNARIIANIILAYCGDEKGMKYLASYPYA